MKDQRSYFEKADFQSGLPLQLLTATIGLALVLLELAVAQWPVFYGVSRSRIRVVLNTLAHFIENHPNPD